MEKQLLNRTEAAAYLGFNRKTLHNWEKQGVGPKPKRIPGGLAYYSRESLDAFVAEFRQAESS